MMQYPLAGKGFIAAAAGALHFRAIPARGEGVDEAHHIRQHRRSDSRSRG